MTYYHRAIRTKDDYWRPYNLPDLHTTDYDEDEEEFDIDKWIELKQSSPFDMSYDPLQVTEIGSEVDDEVDEAIDLEEEYISPEEAANRRERSLISSLNRSKRMIYDYGRANKWEWFLLLLLILWIISMNSTFRNRKESIELVSQHQEEMPEVKGTDCTRAT